MISFILALVTVSQVGKRPQHSSIIIVGAGIAGLSLAYQLSKTTTGITLLESDSTQQGASAVPIALLNPNRGRSARASEFDLAGLASMHELSEELSNLGLEHGIHFSGVLRIAHNPKQRKNFAKLEHVKQLSSEDIPSVYHAPYGAIKIEEGGWLEPKKLLRALSDAAQAKSVTILTNCQVTKLQKNPEGGLTLTASQGQLSADKVVLCVGTKQYLNYDLPQLERMAGDVIRFHTPDITLPQPIAGAVYGMQNGEHTLMGGNHRAEHENDPEAIPRLTKSSSWFIKSLTDAPIASTWSGVRAKHESNKPILKELEPNVWFLGAFGGRGFLTAFHLAKELSNTLLAKANS